MKILMLIVCLLPLILTAAKPTRKVELKGNKLVQRTLDKAKSKGTNEVWNVSREFPMMFQRRPSKAKKKAG